jgi:hypothetical protein
VGWPDLTAPERPPELKFVRPTVAGKVEGGWHEATAELAFLEAPREELADLGLRRAVDASAGFIAMTITGASAR